MNIFKTSLNKIYQPPGTLIYTGKNTDTKNTINLTKYNDNTYSSKAISSTEYITFEDNYNSWLDILGLSDIYHLKDLGKRFNIHNLLLEDILNTNHNPKIENLNEGNFIIIKFYKYKDFSLSKEQISLFINKNILITFQEYDLDNFKVLKERIEKKQGYIRSKNLDYLLFSIFDIMMDNYHLLMSQLQEKMESIEYNLFEKKQKKKIENIYLFRTDIIKVKNTLFHTSEIISQLKKEVSNLEDLNIFYSDLEDKIKLYIEELKYNEEKTKSLIEIYVAVNGDKMNEIMKLLTMVSTIFIPLGFIAGLYGMNFEYMPELKFKYGYFIILFIMLFIVLSMISFIRKKDWF